MMISRKLIIILHDNKVLVLLSILLHHQSAEKVFFKKSSVGNSDIYEAVPYRDGNRLQVAWSINRPFFRAMIEP